MGFADRYLAKQNSRFLFQAPDDLETAELIVVIPCFNEPDISTTIHSLFSCHAPGSRVIVLVVVNDSDQSIPEFLIQNTQTVHTLKELEAAVPEWIILKTIHAVNLPEKHAGAGWARKIGMDWAITHFNLHNQSNGIVISLDADALVEQNYFQAIEQSFQEHPKWVACTIYFEHPIDGAETSEAIVWYELYMRYYKNALDCSGFPNSIYTIGSCFAVKAYAYTAQGGMNRKKAGEDFYFLHKLVPMGTIGSIVTTIVYPSARLSNRVPFGTGPALQKYIDGDNDILLTYPLTAFRIVQLFFNRINDYYKNVNRIDINYLSENREFQLFCAATNLPKDLSELAKNCSTIEVFRKRFFHLFNAFTILKWLNYAQKNGYEKTSLLQQAQILAEELGLPKEKIPNDPKLMLKLYRGIDKAKRNT